MGLTLSGSLNINLIKWVIKMNVLSNCNMTEAEVVIFLYLSYPSTHTHLNTHSCIKSILRLAAVQTDILRGSSRRQVWPRQLCLCLSDAAGDDSTAAQGELPMRHVRIWSLRPGVRPKDRERERQMGRWVRESEGIALGVTDTEGDKGSLHPGYVHTTTFLL